MTAVAGWVRRHPVLAFFLVFAVFPWVVPYKSLATQVLIYGLFALGFNLLYGYTGLLSFGAAAYWGLGAYGTGAWGEWVRTRGARDAREDVYATEAHRGKSFAVAARYGASHDVQRSRHVRAQRRARQIQGQGREG